MSDLADRIQAALAENQRRADEEKERERQARISQAIKDAYRVIIANAEQGKLECEVRAVHLKPGSRLKASQITADQLNAQGISAQEAFANADLAVIDYLSKEGVKYSFIFRPGCEGTVSEPGPSDSIVLMACWQKKDQE